MNKKIEVPAIGKIYKVISGPYKGFIGECVSYDAGKVILPIILQDKEWNTRAVMLNEVEVIESGKSDISRLQQN